MQALSVSLFWTGAVLSNTVHVIVSGMVFLVLIHGGQAAASMPPKPLLKSLQYAVTTSFGSICYGSLFTAAIRTLRWEVCDLLARVSWGEILSINCLPFVYSFSFFIFNFRLEEFVLKLATTSVFCAVLIFSFILWRRLFVSSTNMHMYRSVANISLSI